MSWWARYVVAIIAVLLLIFGCRLGVASAGLGPAQDRELLKANYPDLVDLTGHGLSHGTIDISPGRPGRSAEVSLVSLAGHRLWSTPIPHQQDYAGGRYPYHPDGTRPGLVAAGDFTGDGITDYVLKVTWPTKPAASCGGIRETWSQLLFLDGRDGQASRPLPALEDRCFTFPAAHVAYPKQHWGGMVSIGPFAGNASNDVVAIPTYPSDNRGFVLNFAAHHAWRHVIGRSSNLVLPSDPDYGPYYDSVNAQSCKSPFSAGGSCFVKDSHVPLGVFLRPFGKGGLLIVTSGRAVVYRPDLTPTSDTTWVSGSTQNAGRNYGYLFQFPYRGSTYVELIGGCSVRAERDAMRSGRPPSGQQLTSLRGGDAHCGIHHHFEWFRTVGSTIADHVNRYYSYSVADGFFHARPEFPGNPLGPLGGAGSIWAVFNLYHAAVGSGQGAGQWQIEMLPDPQHPQHVIEQRGWYVWDVVDLHHDGRAELLATRAPRNGYILPWEFDVLEWRHGALISTHHVRGAVPALVKIPNTTTRYELGDAQSSFAAATVPLSIGGGNRLMVEDRRGRRYFLTVTGGGTKASSGFSVSVGVAPSALVLAALLLAVIFAARRQRRIDRPGPVRS